MIDAMCCVPLFQFPSSSGSKTPFLNAILKLLVRYSLCNDLVCIDIKVVIYIRPGGLGLLFLLHACFPFYPIAFSLVIAVIYHTHTYFDSE